ncbi:MAG: 30S ribosomal protein S12 methylthiotransferase RimO [Candidatus Anammoxibacter sp.]
MKSKVNIVSLGCAKNLVDSEKIINTIAKNGGVICDDKHDADVIVVNTCGFINSAKEESINEILEIARLKVEGKCKRLVVTGCLAQRYKSELLKEIPEIDDLIGINKFDKVSSAVLQDRRPKAEGKCSVGTSPCRKTTPKKTKRISLTPKHYAYLKISDGCNNSCTYCTIPFIRGRYKSRPVADIVKEAEFLAANGAKELNIIAQDTTVYGSDIHKKQSLHLLLRKISEIKSVKWIRLLYTHPAHIYDELIDEISQNNKICNYIDLPIQHINDKILKTMGRSANRLQISRLIDKLRSRIENLVLRTSIIVGFPGETEKRFDELVDFIESTRFERLGVFVYSREENTPASFYKNQISKRVKDERYEILMSVQQGIAFDNNQKMIGNKVKVLIDSETQLQNADLGFGIEDSKEIVNAKPKIRNPKSQIPNQTWLGRYYADAPEVDSNVIVHSKHGIGIGTFKNVTINGTDNYDLVGVIDG